MLFSVSVWLNTPLLQCHDRYTYAEDELVYIFRDLMWIQETFHLRGLPKGDATIALACCMLLPVSKAAIVCILPADYQACKRTFAHCLFVPVPFPLASG